MASQLSRDEVAHIAALAQIDLAPSELEMFARQLTDILRYAETIQKADTSGVAPDAATTLPASTQLPGPRADVPAPSLDRAAALANAPDARPDAGLFRAPKVL